MRQEKSPPAAVEEGIQVRLTMLKGDDIIISANQNFTEVVGMDVIKEFYDLAKAFCCFISENQITIDCIPSLMEQLMKLYISAMNLPNTSPEEDFDDTACCAEYLPIIISDEIPQFYWEVFDPFDQEDALCADIADDLSDIAADLLSGIREFEAGRINDAVFDWKFDLDTHWGNHLVDVLRALHALRTH